jgi:GDP-L-fucose synthase
MTMKKSSRIYVAGHRGLVGSAIVRRLEAEGHTNIITRSHAGLDLIDYAGVDDLFDKEKPEYIFLAAAKVGGILANRDYPAEFIRSNLFIQCNIIDLAYEHGVKKLLFLGSSCIYPKHAPQPMKEEYLLSGPLEPTNQWYAIAKIAGIKMCQAYREQYGLNAISLMPTNLYGPNDNYDLETSHVLPAMIRKFHEAKVRGENVTLWGSGSPKREFLHVDDLASAGVHLMQHYDDGEIINVGSGTDLTIRELAETIQEIVEHKGDIIWDMGKPDGTPRKLLDVSRLASTGWEPSIPLREGIRSAYEWFCEHAT